MGAVVCLFCIAIASFAVLAQPAVAQGANTTLPLIYPGQVLQGDGSQTCPFDAQREMLMNEIKNATQYLFRESVVSQLSTQLSYSCGGSGPLPTVSLCVARDHHPTQGVWAKIHHW